MAEIRLTPELLKETATALANIRKRAKPSEKDRKKSKALCKVDRYAKATLDDFRGKEIFAYCKKWVSDPQATLGPMLMGGIGTGKTHFLNALVRELYLVGYTDRNMVKLITSTELIYEIKNAIAQKTTDTVLDRYKSVPVLLLDDLGAERITEWTQEQFYLIIDSRWRYRLPMAITSNYELPHISEMLGERIASRIAGMTQPFVIKGKDWRIE